MFFDCIQNRWIIKKNIRPVHSGSRQVNADGCQTALSYRYKIVAENMINAFKPREITEDKMNLRGVSFGAIYHQRYQQLPRNDHANIIWEAPDFKKTRFVPFLKILPNVNAHPTHSLCTNEAKHQPSSQGRSQLFHAWPGAMWRGCPCCRQPCKAKVLSFGNPQNWRFQRSQA